MRPCRMLQVQGQVGGRGLELEESGILSRLENGTTEI